MLKDEVNFISFHGLFMPLPKNIKTLFWDHIYLHSAEYSLQRGNNRNV